MNQLILLLPIVFSFALFAFTGAPSQPNEDLPAVYTQFSDNVEVYLDGEMVVIKCDGVPNHPSPYFDNRDPRYTPYNGANKRFHRNPNRIRECEWELRIPLHPKKAAYHRATPMGPMGVALNGVPLFNQYAAGRSPLTREANSFDQFNGHPQRHGEYHYHVEPAYITQEKGKDALVGFLLDGFPVYGPIENGQKVLESDLDEFHGHTHPTKDFPEGIYHYHVTDQDPYINGNGFYGKAGVISR